MLAVRRCLCSLNYTRNSHRFKGPIYSKENRAELPLYDHSLITFRIQDIILTNENFAEMAHPNLQVM